MIQWQGLPSYFLSLLIIIREDGGECCNYTISLLEKPFYISFVIIVTLMICFQSIHLTFGCSPCFYWRGPYWSSACLGMFARCARTYIHFSGCARASFYLCQSSSEGWEGTLRTPSQTFASTTTTSSLPDIGGCNAGRGSKPCRF